MNNFFLLKNGEITVIIGVIIGIILIIAIYSYASSSNKFKAVKFKTATPSQCIMASNLPIVTNIQTQISSLVKSVSSLVPPPTLDVLTTFNNAIAGINSQISTLLSLPTCNTIAGRYVKISKSSGYLEIAEVQVFDPTGIQLKPITSTSSAVYADGTGKLYPPTNVYDGNTSTFFVTGSGSTGSLYITLLSLVKLFFFPKL